MGAVRKAVALLYMHTQERRLKEFTMADQCIVEIASHAQQLSERRVMPSLCSKDAVL